jgi:hypothetical protein
MIDKVAPVTPKIAMNQLKMYLGFEMEPLNSMLYNQGGRRKPSIPPQRDPAILRKSMKLGITKATPVTTNIINVLTKTDFILRYLPSLKNLACSKISNATKICTG